MAANFLSQFLSNILSIILSSFTLCLLPIFAGLMVISPFFPNNTVKIRRFAKGFSIFSLIYTLFFAVLMPNPAENAAYDSLQTLQSGFAFKETLPFSIIKSLNITLSLGFDSFSILMCTLASFIILLALIASKSMINSKQKIYYGTVLCLLGLLYGLFSANNLFTFTTFWLLVTIFAYFLTSVWGSNSAKKSALKFALFNTVGAAFMLMASALIYAYCADANISPAFDELMQASTDFPLFLQLVAAVGFSITFMIRMPVFPLHSSISDALYDSISPVSVILSGVLLSTGAYGFVRINLQIFYEIFQVLAPALVLLSLIGVIWASYLAISQNDIKKIVVYYVMAQMGIICAGICSFTEFGTSGAIFHIIASALISAGLFIGSELIYMKFKTRKLEFLGGISKYTPLLAVLMLVLGLCAMASPFTMGFSGEIMSFMGVFNTPLLDKNYFGTNLIQAFTIFASLSIVLSGAYILRLLHKTFFGIAEFEPKYWPKSSDDASAKLSNHQTAVLSIIIAGLVIFGIYPMGIIDKISVFVNTNIANIISTIF